jgi:hypothetical protein
MKTSEKDFELFHNEVAYWVRYYGLSEWYVTTNWEDLSAEGIHVRAMIIWNVPGRYASISLNTDWESDNVTDYNVRLAAFHEVTELMLCEVTDLVNDMHPEDRVQASLHTIVRRLENTLFRSVYEDRMLEKQKTKKKRGGKRGVSKVQGK